MTSSRGFSRYAPQMVAPAPSAEPANRSLLEIIRDLDGASSELVDRNKTIFFPGDPAERVYLIRRGAVVCPASTNREKRSPWPCSAKTASSGCCHC